MQMGTDGWGELGAGGRGYMLVGGVGNWWDMMGTGRRGWALVVCVSGLIEGDGRVWGWWERLGRLGGFRGC